MVRRLLPFFLLFICTTLISAQENMRVVRTKAIDRYEPVRNVHVNEENEKWASNTQGVFKIINIENGKAQSAVGGQINILAYPDGNANLLIPRSDLFAIIGESTVINSMRYDDNKKELWVGTETKGVYQIRTEPSLQQLGHFTTETSKLLSNEVHAIFIDKTGMKWIGTADGALVGEPGKWEHQQRYFHIYGFAEVNNEVWVSTDDLIWWVNRKGKWTPLELDEEMFEGPIIDLDFDQDGRLWMASEILTHFDIAVDSFKTYGPSEYFTSQFVNRIAVDQENAVWIATEDKGLYQIEKENAISINIELEQPLSCSGDVNDAILNVDYIYGGEEPYTYTWSNGMSERRITNLAAGNYLLTVTDQDGIEKVTEFEVPNPVIEVDVVIDGSANADDENGSATANISGGIPEYEIKWANGETEVSATNLAGGEQVLVVSDAAGCSTEVAFEMPQEFETLSILIEVIRENECSGEENAVISYHANGGKKPYTSEWSNGNKMNEASGLSAGIYTVTLTDAAGNTATASVTIEEPEPIQPDIEITAPATANAADGKAKVNVRGGTEPYTYRWSNGATTDELSSLAAGEYFLTVTDANECTQKTSFVMTEDILPLAIKLNAKNDLVCENVPTGSLSIGVSGGKGPMQYQWSIQGENQASVSELSAGTYTLTVTDATGATATETFEIAAPEPFTVEADIQESATSGQNDGKVLARISGAQGGVTYEWSNGESGKTAKGMSVGQHQIIATDAKGCRAMAKFEMTEEILPLSVELQMDGEVLCADKESSGSIEPIVRGGKKPYEYNWGLEGASGDKVTGASAGLYRITVTDAAGNTAVDEIELTAPDPVLVKIDLTSNATPDQDDGRAMANVSGGAGKYNYRWDNGETSKAATALSVGVHQLTVTDANGCTAVQSVEVTEEILPLSVELRLDGEVRCADQSANGSIETIVSGGKRPYDFNWGTIESKDDRITDVRIGTYRLVVTDAQGNTAVDELIVTGPDPLIVDINLTSNATPGKDDGRATANISGGAGKYKYRWDNDETSKAASKLSVGQHVLTVTDGNGCTAVGSVEVTEEILPLAVKLEQDGEILCADTDAGASIKAQVSGGKSPFKYQWDTGATEDILSGVGAGNYRLVVTDSEGNTAADEIELTGPEAIEIQIDVTSNATPYESDGRASALVSGGAGKFKYNWDNGETSKVASKLNAGVHQMTVTDGNGCTSVASVEVTEEILPLSVEIRTTQEIQCAGLADGAVEAIVKGGKKPFVYYWNSDFITEQSGSNLDPGSYQLTVTDAAGTTAMASIELNTPDPLVVEINVVSSATTNNSDGNAIAQASGGVAPYQYAWDNDEDDAEANRLAPGTRKVIVTDKNGCTVEQEVEITEDILPLAVNITGTEIVDCYGNFGGELTAQVRGGKSPFTYAWSTGQKTEKIDQLGAGEYELTVQDATGNSVSAKTTITEPSNLDLSIDLISPANTGATDGHARANVTGGTAPYSYKWDTGDNQAEVKTFAPGNHTLVVTDANGCTVSGAIEINEEILPLEVEIEVVSQISCNGQQDGSLRAVVRGGKGPMQYQWTGAGGSGQEIVGVGAAQLQIAVTDVTGQRAEATLDFKAPEPLVAQVVNKKPTRTERTKNGQGTVEVSGGTPPFSFLWDNEEAAQTAKELAFGLNTVVVTDANGCTAEASVDIEKKILPDLTAGMIRNGQTIKIEKLQFEADSTEIIETSVPVLNEIYDFLIDNPFIIVEIGGHTNGLPSHEFCDRLSTARAKNVADFMIQKGIDSKRVIYKGYGKRDPIATNQTPEGRRRNQRVEVKILQIEEGDE